MKSWKMSKLRGPPYSPLPPQGPFTHFLSPAVCPRLCCDMQASGPSSFVPPTSRRRGTVSGNVSFPYTWRKLARRLTGRWRYGMLTGKAWLSNFFFSREKVAIQDRIIMKILDHLIGRLFSRFFHKYGRLKLFFFWFLEKGQFKRLCVFLLLFINDQSISVLREDCSV